MIEKRRLKKTGEIVEIEPMYASPLLGSVPIDRLDDWPMSEDWVVMVRTVSGKRVCMPLLRWHLVEWLEELEP